MVRRRPSADRADDAARAGRHLWAGNSRPAPTESTKSLSISRPLQYLNACVRMGNVRCRSREEGGILLQEWANFLNSFAGHLVVCMGVATFAPICRGCGVLTGEMGEWLKPTVC